MPSEQFGFLIYSLEELHEHLEEELARNPFLNIAPDGTEQPGADDPWPPREDPQPPS